MKGFLKFIKDDVKIWLGHFWKMLLWMLVIIVVIWIIRRDFELLEAFWMLAYGLAVFIVLFGVIYLVVEYSTYRRLKN